MIAYKIARSESFIAASSLITILHGLNTCLYWQQMKKAHLSCLVGPCITTAHKKPAYNFSQDSQI